MKRLNVIQTEPDYYFPQFRSNLERLLNSFMLNDYFNTKNNLHQPLMEVREDSNQYLVKVQLPGIKKEDIDIDIENNTVSISAEHKFEELKDQQSLHLSQLSYGKYQKTFELGKKINPDKSTCQYKDGILTLHLKKIEEKIESKKLKIE